jgi:RNA polymerase sigma factor for flagellar operon FliA
MGCLSILSLEEVLSDADGEGTSLHERLADPDAEDPLETSALEERRERLAAAIDSLPAQERLVVALIYHEGLTMREVTDLLELSAARISQIHSKAILRLRGKLARSKELMVS